MKFVDFNDDRIPIGKRKVAYVKWAMMKGTPEKKAKELANKKFGWERHGKYLVFIYNCEDLRLPSMRGLTWEDASCIDCQKAESVIVVPDDRPPMEIAKGKLPAGFPEEHGLITIWAYDHGYKVSKQYLCS